MATEPPADRVPVAVVRKFADDGASRHAVRIAYTNDCMHVAALSAFASAASACFWASSAVSSASVAARSCASAASPTA